MKNNSKTFREVSKQKMIEQGLNVVAGVDLGDKHSHVCLIDLDGNIVERKKLSTSPAAFERYFGGWAAMRVVLEAGCHANWIYRLLERLGHEPLMADTHRLALITQSLSKDDRSDAERLAELGLRMPEMLNAVEPRSLAIQCDRAVLKARETLVETRTKLINSVRGTVKSFGGRLPASSSEAFVKKASPQLPDELRVALEPLLEVIQHVSAAILHYDKHIEKGGRVSNTGLKAITATTAGQGTLRGNVDYHAACRTSHADPDAAVSRSRRHAQLRRDRPQAGPR